MYGTYVICGTMTGYTDGFKELDFITGLSMEPFVLAVNADSPYQTLDDLIQLPRLTAARSPWAMQAPPPPQALLPMG